MGGIGVDTVKKRDFKNRSPLRIFVSYFSNHRLLFAIDVLCACGIAAIDLLFPLITRKALYTWLPEEMYKTFFAIMLIVVGCYLLRSCLNFIVAYFGHTFGIRVEADIRRDLFHHMQKMSFDFYDRNRTGQLMSRLTSDLFELTELAHHGPEDLLTSCLTIIGAVIVMLRIRWELAVIVLLMIPVFLVIVMTMRRRMMQASRKAKEKTGLINQEIESSLSGIRTAKAFANEDMECARFDAANEQFKTSKRQHHKAMGQFHSCIEFFLCSLNVVIIGVGGYFVMRKDMDYRDLTTFVLYISSFVTPMRKLANFSEMFSNGFAGLNRFVSIMRTDPTIQDKPDAKPLEQVQGKIEVEDVTFAYDRELDVLRNVNLTVQPGETIAVVGPSGGGKTTVLRLMLGLVEPRSGSIEIESLDGEHMLPVSDSTRRLCAFVPQGNSIFSGTIESNFRAIKPDVTEEEIVAALKIADAWSFVSALPNTFHTELKERGGNLSEGQLQRLSIARAILRDAPILIMDEATSALDVDTEARVLKNLMTENPNRICLITTHRPSMLAYSDIVFRVSGEGDFVRQDPSDGLGWETAEAEEANGSETATETVG